MREKRSRAICIIRVWGEDDHRLEKATAVVSSLNGVEKSSAQHTTHMLTVEYDPERITLDTIQNAVRRIDRQ
jgi:hypothetical protein